MSRFKKEDVAQWPVVRVKSGRKLATGTVDGREVKVWVSDIEDDDGFCPHMGRYLLPYEVPVVEGTKIVSTSTIWVTRKQLHKITEGSRSSAKSGGIEDLIHVLAKAFDNVGELIEEKIGNRVIVDKVLAYVFEKVSNKYLNIDMLDDLFDKLDDE